MTLRATLPVLALLTASAAAPVLADQTAAPVAPALSARALATPAMSASRLAAPAIHLTIPAPIASTSSVMRRALRQNEEPDPNVGKKWSVMIGGLTATDDGGADADLGFSIAGERVITTTERGDEVVGSLRYSRYTLSSGGAEAEINNIHVMGAYRLRPGTNKKFYIEPTAGLVLSIQSAPGFDAQYLNFAYGVGAGYDFGPVLVDLRYLLGGKAGERGFIFSLGKRF